MEVTETQIYTKFKKSCYMTERRSFSNIPAFMCKADTVYVSSPIDEYKLDLKFRRREGI